MQSTRIVQGSHAALVIAACVGLISPARTWADNPTDRPLVSSSVPDTPKGGAAAPPADSGEELSREQVQEAADQLLLELGAALQGLVSTMVNWDLPPPVPETIMPMNLQPPDPPIPESIGDGPLPPPPNNQSPEPGTLIAGIAGAGAMLYRYRRRRAKNAGRDEKEETSEKKVELAM